MSRLPLLVLVLALLPSVVGADPLGAPVEPDSTFAGARTVSADPALDLRFEPPVSELPKSLSLGLRSDRGARAQEPLERFSVGLNINTRREVGDEAKDGSSGTLNLTDEVTGIVERSTFGLTGTYRF